MPDNSEPDHSPSPNSGISSMVGWLGFFLLVFVVAGLAFYLAGDSQKAADSSKPMATTQGAR